MSDREIDKLRRRVLIAGAAAAAGLVSPRLAALTPTPPQSRGPFYPTDIPLDHDSDLTRVEDRRDPAEGTPVDVAGRVLDARGRPVNDVRVEIWQCDARGRYRHPLDRGRRAPDPGFQGYGVTRSNQEGGYRFRTIRPVAYPGRAPHIHFAIRDPQGHTLVTQMYVAGAPENEWDFLLGRLNAEQRSAVIVPFGAEGAPPGAEQIGRFDIVLDVERGTPVLG
jgi:protocatechuate 3,4-dioxygenase beta subunit